MNRRALLKGLLTGAAVPFVGRAEPAEPMEVRHLTNRGYVETVWTERESRELALLLKDLSKAGGAINRARIDAPTMPYIAEDPRGGAYWGTMRIES